MSSFISFVIVAVVAIAVVAYISSGAGSRRGGTNGQKTQNRVYRHRCPFCGADYGDMPNDRTVCGDCMRTYVIGREPNAGEKGVMEREASEIAFLNSPSFPLETVKQAAAEAFCNGKTVVAGPGDTCIGAEFKPDHLEALVFSSGDFSSVSRRVSDYPMISTDAARHALTVMCFRHLSGLYGSMCSRRGAELGDFTITWNNN